MFDVVTEFFFGKQHVLRSIKNSSKALYLTFDDGPHGDFTLKVLDVLERANAKATFFMIAQKAQEQKAVVQEVVARGHRLGNHSLDHNHSVFFSNQDAIRHWIESSEHVLREVSQIDTVGFRPPNGVLTPHLLKATEQLKIPVYLWNRRFFDTVKMWSEKSALKALSHLKSGDIILLHDRQKTHRENEFLKTLKTFLSSAKQKGFRFEPLPYSKENV